MALIKSVKGKKPIIPDSCFLVENATIVGDVVFGEKCSVWFNAVVRGDVHSIRIGNNVSIAHNAIIHGCIIQDNVLVGMGAIIMDGVIIESNSIIAAGAVVSKDTIIESGSVWAGVPAKKIKEIDESLVKNEIERIANNYMMYASWYD
jgi:carbonic anhydrase/acetyltransferase-like protein (isoleucine patch superfamily)